MACIRMGSEVDDLIWLVVFDGRSNVFVEAKRHWRTIFIILIDKTENVYDITASLDQVSLFTKGTEPLS